MTDVVDVLALEGNDEFRMLGEVVERECSGCGRSLASREVDQMQLPFEVANVFVDRGPGRSPAGIGADSLQKNLTADTWCPARGSATDPASVTHVNIASTAKMPALKSHAVDIISDFYNEHDLKVAGFGADPGLLPWSSLGINPYGNSIVVNGDYLESHKDVVKSVINVTQRVFAVCAKDEEPWLRALLADVSGLDIANRRNQWQRIKELMRDRTTTAIGLGWFDASRMASDYALVKIYLGTERPFDATKAYTNEFVDASVKMTQRQPELTGFAPELRHRLTSPQAPSPRVNLPRHHSRVSGE